MGRHSAFTFIELLIVIVIMAILAVAAMPDPITEAKEQGRSACMRFEADVIYARSLSIARPDDLASIVVDEEADTYQLERASQPGIAVLHPLTGKPFVRAFGPGGDPGLEHVGIVYYAFEGDDGKLGLDALGGTDQETPAVLRFESAGATYEVSVSPVAARVNISAG